MKIYHMADQEGTSGVTDFEDIALDTIENWFKRRRIQELQTAEVKAAVEGHAVIVTAAKGLISDREPT